MKSSWITPTIITATIPIIAAIAYGIAYAFEWGYCSIFGIPTYLIELTVNNVLFAVSTVVILLAFTILIWYPYVYIPLDRLSKRWGKKFSFLAGGLFVVIVFMLLYQEVWLRWVPLLIVVVTLGIILFVIPIIYIWIAKGLNWIKQKIFLFLGRSKEKEIQKEEAVPAPAIESSTELTKRKLAFIILGSAFILFYIAFAAGQATAEMQDEFFITTDPTDCVVLRIYGNNLICAPIDKEKVKISGSIFITRVDNLPGFIMKLEKIGRLNQK